MRYRGLSHAWILVLVLAAGCGTLRGVLSGLPRSLGGSPTGEPELSEEELRAELAAFVTRFAGVLGSLGTGVSGAGVAPEVRVRVLLLPAQLVPLAQLHLLDPDPRATYVSLLSLTVLLRQYVTEGEGSSEFGDQQRTVQRALRELEASLLQIGARFLAPRDLARVRERVENFAHQHSLQRGVVATQVQEAVAALNASDLLGDVLRLPLAPFRALEGVNEGAAAVHEFTQVAHVLTAIAATLPAQLRWQSQLLLLELEQRPIAAGLIEATHAATRSVEQLGAAAAALPENLQELLGATSGPLTDLQRALDSARQLSGPVTRAAREVGAAGDAWAAVVARKGGDENEAAYSATAGGGAGSGAQAWGGAAREVEVAAARVERATLTLRALLESPRSLQGLAAAAQAVGSSARQVQILLVCGLAAAAGAGALLVALVWGLAAVLRRRPS